MITLRRAPARATILILMTAALQAFAASGHAAPNPAPAVLSPGDMTAGGLLLRGRDDSQPSVAAPLLGTDVTMAIAGSFARVTVRQHFHNPNDAFVEGVYVFPLPDEAAVDHLRMQIGDRFIDGVIKEREQARRDYEQARAQGQRASLLEQERANMFTASVANIGPGETVIVEIEYQDTARFSDGAYAIRFPMVVGPRYVPGPAMTLVDDGRGADGAVIAAPVVSDTDRITPPVRHPDAGAINPVVLSATLNAGFPIDALESPYHPIDTQELENGIVEISFADGPVPADRNFELVWRPAPGAAPEVVLFREQRGEQKYGVLTLMPPVLDPTGPAPERDMVFVIDTSGSMEGESIGQAKAALHMALDRLRPQDRFNVIQFNDQAHALFGDVRSGSANTIDRARRYVTRLDAEGGTEMLPALGLALRQATDGTRLRQIIFLTDGAIGDEAALFAEISDKLGDGRLFTVGIGSAPNSYFMSRAAAFGRGSFTHIGASDEVAEKMAALFRKLERPALTDIEIAWPADVDAEVYPTPVPDLYYGDPITVAVAGVPETGQVTVTGRFQGRAWRTPVDLSGGTESAGARVVWARRKIRALMDDMHRGADPDVVRESVVATALDHHLMSRYTSLVAVDVTPVRPADEPVHTVEMPTNLPHGWDFDAVFGTPEMRARGAALPAPAMQQASADAMTTVSLTTPLPQTATPAALRVLIGLMLLFVAGLVWLSRRHA